MYAYEMHNTAPLMSVDPALGTNNSGMNLLWRGNDKEKRIVRVLPKWSFHIGTDSKTDQKGLAPHD